MPTVYRSSDASVPVINSTQGSLTTALDAILVNGYGIKAAAGWTIAQTATNKRDYQQGGTSNKLILSVHDAGPNVTSLGKEARAFGFATSSGIGAGTGQFPTVGQLATGITIRKSAEADGGATARTWICVADTRTVYLFVFTTDNAGFALAFGFGDIYSYQSGDALKAGIWGRNAENSAVTTVDKLDVTASGFNVVAGNYMAASYTGTGGSINVGKVGDPGRGSTTILAGTQLFPNAPDGGLYLSKVYITEVAGYIRGYMRGFYHFLHVIANLNDGDTFNGSGDYAGRSFMVVKTSGNSGVYVIETTTWDTSS